MHNLKYNVIFYDIQSQMLEKKEFDAVFFLYPKMDNRAHKTNCKKLSSFF